MNPLLIPQQDVQSSELPPTELPTQAELLARTEPEIREPAGEDSTGINPLAFGMLAGGLLVVVVMRMVLKRADVSAQG